MQPFQCDLQQQLQEPHRTTHTGTTTRCKTHRTNNETNSAAPAAQTRYLSSPHADTLHGKHTVPCSGFLPKIYITHATFMQPFQCDLQQMLQEPHRTTHTGTTNRCKTHRRNNSRMKRPQPHPPHRRGTFLRHLQTLYTEKHTVSCPGFLPKHYPCNIHAAIPMRSCNQRFKNRIELRTQEQPLVGKRIGGTIRAWNDPSRTRRTEEVPFIAGCSHFRRKTQGFVLRLPRNIARATFMQPFQCDHATRNSRTAANRNNHSLQNT